MTSINTRCVRARPTPSIANFAAGISDQALAELVITLRNEDRLCIVQEERTDARTTDYLFIRACRKGERRTYQCKLIATRTHQLLRDFEFETLWIEELGWDRHRQGSRCHALMRRTIY